MRIGPVKKISRVGKNKEIKYYSNRGYNKKFDEVLERKKKEEKQEEKFEVEKNQRNRPRRDSENSQDIYYVESLTIRNSKIYNRLTSKDEKDIIPEHKTSKKLQMAKLKEVYGRRRKISTSDSKEKDNNDMEIKEKEQVTKKQEMEKFKESLKQKSDLDIACEEFSRELEKRNKEKKRVTRRGHLADYDESR